MSETKKDERINNQEDLARVIKEVHASKAIIEQENKKIQDLAFLYLNHHKIRAIKFNYVGKFVRQGFDVDDLCQEADLILLQLAEKYLKDKPHKEIITYVSFCFPKMFIPMLRKLRCEMISLDELELEIDMLENPNGYSEEGLQDLKFALDALGGTVRDVGYKLLEGRSLTEIEKELKLGSGCGWYYKEILKKRLKVLLEELDVRKN